MIKIVLKRSVIGELILQENTFDSIAIFVDTFKTILLAPLFSNSLKDSILKLPIYAFLFSNNSSFSIWKIILEKTIVIKLSAVHLPIALSFHTVKFTFEVRFIMKRLKLTFNQLIHIVMPHFLNILSQVGLADLLEKSIGIDCIVLHLLSANLALAHY